MNNTKKGFYRDRAITEAVEQYGGILDAEQIRLMFFSDIPSGERVSRRRLSRLISPKVGKLKRARELPTDPFAYQLPGRKVGQTFHRIGVNWIRLWLESRLKPWEMLHCWEYEQDYGIVRPDAFCAIRNTKTGKFTAHESTAPRPFLFIEFDVATSGNNFDKVEKYNKLYESCEVLSHWWACVAERFPAILIVTTTAARAHTIRQRIGAENDNGLKFVVYELEQIKGESRDNQL